MTQAFNLSQFANNLDPNGRIDAADGLVNAVPLVNGGTGATTAAAAQSNLNVPSRTGAGASGTWDISITGNAATAANATNAQNANRANSAATADNGGVTSVNGMTGNVNIPASTPVAGNGISVSGSTVSVAAPGGNTIGSYALVYRQSATGGNQPAWTFGGDYPPNGTWGYSFGGSRETSGFRQSGGQVSGTWRSMGCDIRANGGYNDSNVVGGVVAVRVA